MGKARGILSQLKVTPGKSPQGASQPWRSGGGTTVLAADASAMGAVFPSTSGPPWPRTAGGDAAAGSPSLPRAVAGRTWCLGADTAKST